MREKPIYQTYLREEYERRKHRNKTYSLRAFARDLGVQSSKLSQYLSGTCGLSGNRALHIACKMRLSPVESELFVSSAEAEHSRNPISREMAKGKVRELLAGPFSKINVETFNLIRDWYHMAILELTEVTDFKPDVKWVAKALQISESQAKEAIQRLKNLGLLKGQHKTWIQTQKDFETSPDLSSRAVREFHHQMLNLVDSRFEQASIDKRELGSVVLALDQELVPEIKQLIRRFQKEAAAIAERSCKKNSVYTLNFQFMPIFEGSTSCDN